ncbi:MAG: hypothetical protein ACUVV0_03830 [Anaerolineae bacterium]
MEIKGNGKPISSEEWLFVVALIIILLILTALPYIFGYISAPPEQQFMGLLLNVSDHTQYFSWYREFQSSFLIENKLTPEPNEPVFFNLLWWVLAKIGLWTGLGLIEVFQVFRFFAGAIFVCVIYWFCAMFFDEVWERKIATIVITCGYGLGWILVVLKYTLTRGELLFPHDVHSRVGTNSFLCIMSYPHFTMANALIVATLALVLIGYKKQRLSYSFGAGLVALILAWQHAYDLITIYAVLLAFTIFEAIRRKSIPRYLVKSGLIVGFLSCWAAFYSLYITNVYPIWKQVLAQFVNAGVLTADPFHMVIVMGLPLILAVLTFDGLVPLKNKELSEVLIKTWFIVTFFVGYLPTVYQVHLTNCWQVPVGILATYGLFYRVIPYINSLIENRRGHNLSRERLSRILSIAFVLLVLPTNIYLLGWRFVDLNRHEYPYFLYKDDIAALAWLEENTMPSDVVLSSITIGQYIPALSGNKAFLAHWADTVDFFGKTKMVDRFFDLETDDSYRLNLLDEFDVRYIFYGREERGLGRYDPDASPYLVKVFSSPGTQIFRVESGAMP